MALPLLGDCAEHGLFEFRGIAPDLGVSVTITGCRATCPECSRMSPVLDGVFRLHAGDVVEVLAAPGFTLERLRALRESVLLAKAYAKTNPARALVEVEKVEPAVGRALRRLSPSDRIAALSAILSAVSILVSIWLSMHEPPAPEQVQQVIVNVFNEWSVPYDGVEPAPATGAGDASP